MLRRGPSAWSHLGKWDLARPAYEAGAWLRGNLYPQRCDVSPDGRWFCYFTLKGSVRGQVASRTRPGGAGDPGRTAVRPTAGRGAAPTAHRKDRRRGEVNRPRASGSAEWKAGATYVAISRLPWLTALAAWGTCGTWTSGLHFLEDGDVWQAGAPDEGDVGPCRKKLGIAFTRPAAFAVERRRGWTETPDSPPRAPGDMWDERRADVLKMEKARPQSGGTTRLVVQGPFAAFRSSLPGWPPRVRYDVVEGGRVRWLEGVQWADWDAEGRLLVATTDARLQIRDASNDGLSVVSEVDLSSLTPSPSAPPKEAYRW